MPEPIIFPAVHAQEPSQSIGLTPDRLLELLTENVGATVAVIGRDLRFLYVNRRFADWFEVGADRLLGRPIEDVYGAHNQLRYMPFLQRAFAGEIVRYQRQVRNPSGLEEWHSICLTPCRDPDGHVFAIVTSALDVHELRVTTEALRAANQRLSSHMENSPLAVVEIDAASRIVYCSARGGEMFGWQPGEARGRALADLLPVAADPGHPLGASLARLQDGREARNRVEADHARPNGTVLHCEWFNSGVTDVDGKLLSIMSLVEDVSARVVASRRLEQLAARDPLTGLLNRSAFLVRVDDSIARASDPAQAGALLYIDLDGFKRINDALGHTAGDQVLREVSKRLLEAVRDGDTVARLGGDEFAVLLEVGLDAPVVGVVGQRIVDALAPPIELSTGPVQIGASIGVALYPPADGDSSGLIESADRAMYDAKRAGKGRIRYAENRRASAGPLPDRGSTLC